ncbi:hypothetical protein ACIP6Q_38185 [Streptomyces bobili]|uniref:hypothetical protein n=1 Tax=Streptomyces bobili TaxID=67280 RepID=UPI003829BCAD
MQLYGHPLKDRSTMYDLASRLELTAASEDNRVLDALAHARRYKTSRDYTRNGTGRHRALPRGMASRILLCTEGVDPMVPRNALAATTKKFEGEARTA